MGHALLCVSLLPWFLSGPVRALSHLAIEGSLIVGFAVAIALAVLLVLDSSTAKPNSVYTASSGYAGVALFLLLSGMCVAQLYHFDYSGMVRMGGGDIGGHVHYVTKFSTIDPDAYHGFVSFFASAYWVERLLGLNPFESFRLLFYVTVAIFTFVLATLAFRVSSETTKLHGQMSWVFVAILATAAYLPANRILLPILHYLQADGFYPQLFGVIPLLLTWVGYSIGERQAIRFALLAFGLVLYRFTYGLNLGDFFVTVALIMVFEQRQLSAHKFLSVAYLSVAAVLLSLGGYSYSQLAPLFGMKGGIVLTEMHYVIAGTALLALLTAGSRWCSAAVDAGPIFRRSTSFAAAFGLANASALALYWSLGFPKEYYFYKYNQHSAIVLVGAAIVVGGCLVWTLLLDLLAPTNKMSNRSRTNFLQYSKLAALAVGMLAALKLLALGYAPYRPSFVERSRQGVEAQHIGPMAELGGWKIISSVLSEQRKSFGGYIDPNWPQSTFTNSAFGFHGDYPQWLNGIVRKEPGHCVFWQANAPELRSFNDGKPFAVIARLTAQTTPTVIPYQSPVREYSAALGYVCF